ncbi:camphor resistance protein CrcB [Pseudoxanthomonas sp. GM95]|uniref:fluoride efflux transporter CrcB n=1 Tax=Pseudoxanthomonas sp. GM95 TaxID=1881043 RepID=UPI0008D88593|nr:fluoride efflux transporter CrcB [Pseudoxanthomonas sp. GM95]SEL06968.1 camphor resistance protein CrcB [Pseudoxanthomonas sp. GM95]
MNPAIWWQQLALVMGGGALGAGMRFWIGGMMLRQFGSGLPYGTLAVNFLGSLIGGFLVVWLEGRGPSALYVRAFLIVGILGGLTTFSSLMMESLIFARTGRSAVMLANLGISLVGGLVLVFLGAWVAGLLRVAP